MTEPRLDAHGSETVRALFDENTSDIRSLGEIVDKHDGDGIRLTPDVEEDNNIDDGEDEFVEDSLPTDPSENWESIDDSFPGTVDEDGEGLGETDLTGTATGIARGFGSHVPLDLGSDGFQIEELPGRVVIGGVYRAEGEELDDYDDADYQNGKFDSKSLVDFEQPGDNPVTLTDEEETAIERPISFDEQIDSAYKD